MAHDALLRYQNNITFNLTIVTKETNKMTARTNEEETHFHWADYLVFIAVLVLSAAIGVFYAWKDRKKKTAENFLVADGSMSPAPVGISMFVSFLSAISILADPMEVYRYGLVYWYMCVGYCLVLPFVAHFIGIKFHKMKLISANEYIERRFNKYLKIIVSTIRVLTALVFGGVLLLAPSLALSQVSPLDVWMSIVIVGLVCTFYTTLGGLKAVLWADTLQCFIMLAGLLAVLIRAAVDVGGIRNVWAIAEERGRINLNKIDPNPLQHATVWTYLAGGIFRTLSFFSTTQGQIQRYSSLPTERSVTISVYIALPLFFIFGSLLALTGLVMYAYYHDCDPLLTGRISQSDQMLPLLTMDVLGFLPGIPGLFIACIFSACMSSLSTGYSGVAASLLKDFIMPIYEKKTQKHLSPVMGNILSKVVAMLIGLITIGLAFALLQSIDAGLFRMTNLITGSFGAPISGIFLTGLLFPFVGDVAIIAGFIVSLAGSFWLGIGAFLEPNTIGRLPDSIDGCPWQNISNASIWQNQRSSFDYPVISEITSISGHLAELHSMNSTGFHVTDLYKMSSLLSYALGPTLTTLVGFIVTGIIYVFMKGRNRKSDKYPVELSGGMSSEQKTPSMYDNPLKVETFQSKVIN